MTPDIALKRGDFLQNGKYEILEKLGQGGFGITYLARHTILKVEIAIKELFLSSQSTYCTRSQTDKTVIPFFDHSRFDEFKKHFLDEAYTLARFKGVQGIVQVIDTFEENGTVYFVMEFIDGKSIKKMVEEKGAFSEQEAKDIIIKLLDALDAVHKKGVLHRDINPNNILIDKSGQPVLIDFGIAREYQEDVTQTHTTFRTASYSAPEQALVRVKRGAFTDIYSIGGTLYFMLTGNPPQSSDEIDLEGFKSPKEIRPEISEPVNQAVVKAIRKKPQERFQSCAEFKDALVSGKIAGAPVFDETDDRTIIDDQQSKQKTIEHKPKNPDVAAPVPEVSNKKTVKVQPTTEPKPAVKPKAQAILTGKIEDKPANIKPIIKRWIIFGTMAVVVIMIAVFFWIGNEKRLREKQVQREMARQDSIRIVDSIYQAEYEAARLQAYNDSVSNAQAYANSPEGKAKKLLLGAHLFSCYFIGSDEQFGKVYITEQNGKLRLEGTHQNGQNWVKINGFISKIFDERKFEFTGNITAHNPSDGPDCSWDGSTIFFASGSRVYWRNQGDNCYTLTGDTDIYFTAGGM